MQYKKSLSYKNVNASMYDHVYILKLHKINIINILTKLEYSIWKEKQTQQQWKRNINTIRKYPILNIKWD